jgi:hypothetical protein
LLILAGGHNRTRSVSEARQSIAQLAGLLAQAIKNASNFNGAFSAADSVTLIVYGISPMPLHFTETRNRAGKTAA